MPLEYTCNILVPYLFTLEDRLRLLTVSEQEQFMVHISWVSLINFTYNSCSIDHTRTLSLFLRVTLKVLVCGTRDAVFNLARDGMCLSSVFFSIFAVRISCTR